MSFQFQELPDPQRLDLSLISPGNRVPFSISIDETELDAFLRVKRGYSIADVKRHFAAWGAVSTWSDLYSIMAVESSFYGDPTVLDPKNKKKKNTFGLFQGQPSNGWPAVNSKDLAMHVPMLKEMVKRYSGLQTKDFMTIYAQHNFGHKRHADFVRFYELPRNTQSADRTLRYATAALQFTVFIKHKNPANGATGYIPVWDKFSAVKQVLKQFRSISQAWGREVAVKIESSPHVNGVILRDGGIYFAGSHEIIDREHSEWDKAVKSLYSAGGSSWGPWGYQWHYDVLHSASHALSETTISELDDSGEVIEARTLEDGSSPFSLVGLSPYRMPLQDLLLYSGPQAVCWDGSTATVHDPVLGVQPSELVRLFERELDLFLSQSPGSGSPKVIEVIDSMMTKTPSFGQPRAALASALTKKAAASGRYDAPLISRLPLSFFRLMAPSDLAAATAAHLLSSTTCPQQLTVQLLASTKGVLALRERVVLTHGGLAAPYSLVLTPLPGKTLGLRNYHSSYSTVAFAQIQQGLSAILARPGVISKLRTIAATGLSTAATELVISKLGSAKSATFTENGVVRQIPVFRDDFLQWLRSVAYR